MQLHEEEKLRVEQEVASFATAAAHNAKIAAEASHRSTESTGSSLADAPKHMSKLLGSASKAVLNRLYLRQSSKNKKKKQRKKEQMRMIQETLEVEARTRAQGSTAVAAAEAQARKVAALTALTKERRPVGEAQWGWGEGGATCQFAA